jgi:hypothetical protein
MNCTHSQHDQTELKKKEFLHDADCRVSRRYLSLSGAYRHCSELLHRHGTWIDCALQQLQGPCVASHPRTSRIKPPALHLRRRAPPTIQTRIVLSALHRYAVRRTGSDIYYRIYHVGSSVKLPAVHGEGTVGSTEEALPQSHPSNSQESDTHESIIYDPWPLVEDNATFEMRKRSLSPL